MDERGVFTEVFRQEWPTQCDAVQWNVVQSGEGVLRGVHVHADHDDYLTVVAGVLVLGLHDLRADSETAGMSKLLTIDAANPKAITIPVGVCHGFYYPVPSIHVYGVSVYWNLKDELGCRFDSPELGLEWPESSPILSERDRHAMSYREMRDAYLRRKAELRAEASP